MDIILLERIEKLGQMGDVVSVKDGFARNFLLPQKKALRANDANRAKFQDQRVHLEANNLEKRTEAEAIGAKLGDKSCSLLRQAGENGQLYGSVTIRDIAEQVTNMGFAVDRRQIALDKPIKSLGIYPVKVMLHPEVAVTVNISVARSQEEADRQLLAGDGSDEQVIAAEAFFESKELAEEAVEGLSDDEESDDGQTTEAPQDGGDGEQKSDETP